MTVGETDNSLFKAVRSGLPGSMVSHGDGDGQVGPVVRRFAAEGREEKNDA